MFISVKGKMENLENYSLICLISVLRKIMEHVLLDSIPKQVEDNKIVWNSQHGLAKDKS